MNLQERVCQGCRMNTNGNCHTQVKPINFEGGHLPPKPINCGHFLCGDGPRVAKINHVSPTSRWTQQLVTEMDGQTHSVEATTFDGPEKIGFFIISRAGLIYTRQGRQNYATDIPMADI